MFFPDTDDLTTTTRMALALLVDFEQRRTRSRSTAYYNVAKLIGSSSSWVQKFLRDTGEVREPRLPLFLRICVAYKHLCERIEQENERDEIRLRILKDKIDAVAAGVASKTKT